ncbi:MAG: hypothetical protein PF505_01160 [Vallitaleaceae bacterium]|jgi:hypothetical protein|nr:hypothetical protein [Vallitaleaceae bacterium]
MKILDQYLYAINRKLPTQGKDEIIKELKSLLLDSIESRYGKTPTDSEVRSVIQEFGSPAKVAHEYGSASHIINSEYSDLYYLICKIVSLSLLGSFTIIFIIQVISEGLQNMNIPYHLLQLFSNTLFAAISAIGVITLIFILISKYVESADLDLSKDWTPDDLPEIPASKEKVSKAESIASIIFILIAITIFNTFPEIMNLGFYDFQDAGFSVGHTVLIDRFYDYMLFINIIWLIEIFYNVAALITGRITKSIRFIKIIIGVASISLFFTMYNDTSLYLGKLDLFGARGVFLLIAIIGCIELITNTVKLLFKSN